MYNLNDEIGRKTDSIVYLASEKEGGSKEGTFCEGFQVRMVRQEADIMKALQNSASAVQFRGSFDGEEDKGNNALYMEHCSGGDLGSFVEVS